MHRTASLAPATDERAFRRALGRFARSPRHVLGRPSVVLFACMFASQAGLLVLSPILPELARDFGVGRTSVREGLQKLRAHGLIESRKGLGAFVAASLPDDPLGDFARWTKTDPRAIEDLVEGRFALEALASALAALRATPEDVEALERHHREHAAAGRRGDARAVVSADEAFHSRIMAAAHNQFLARMYGMFIAELTEFRRNTLALPWAVERSAKGHAAILDAIRAQDPAAARAAMTDHLWVLYEEVHASATDGGGDAGLRPLPRAALR